MKKASTKLLISIFFSLSLLISFFLSPFASSLPDGLEKVAITKGFANKETNNKIFKSPFADYSFPFIKNQKISTALAGLTGTIIVFSGTLILLGLPNLKNRKKGMVQSIKSTKSIKPRK